MYRRTSSTVYYTREVTAPITINVCDEITSPYGDEEIVQRYNISTNSGTFNVKIFSYKNQAYCTVKDYVLDSKISDYSIEIDNPPSAVAARTVTFDRLVTTEYFFKVKVNGYDT